MARLGANRYGKSRVRVSRITRLGDRHEFNEWTVHVMLRGDFETSYTAADNSKVLPTDTMKNTVYFVARGSKAATIEAFAMELGDYFLDSNLQVSNVSIAIEEKAWHRIEIDGTAEATSFRLGGPELNTVSALRSKGREWEVTSGVDGLTILKTTKSAFTGYIKDKLTTLKPATDLVIAELASVHFQQMACGCQCQADAGEIGSGRRGGERWDAVRLRYVVAGPVELTLQIRLGDLQIAQGHADVFVTH